MKNNLKVFKPIILGVLSVFGICSCEHEDISIGSEVLNKVALKSKSLLVDVETTNLAPEPIRSDRAMIEMNLGENIFSDKATVGVYNEPTFGKTKSDFYSQVRLSALSPQFGENARVDSIVLNLSAVAFGKEPVKKEDRLIDTRYILSKKDNKCEIKDTLYIYQQKSLMRLDSLYGDTSKKINIQVHRVTEGMGDVNTQLLSNKSFTVGELLGEAEISNKAYIIKEISSQGNIDDKGAILIKEDKLPKFHIRLKNLENLFQQEVLAKKENTEDQITFINNVLKGIKISTNSNDGFIFTFAPNDTKITMYYSYDNPEFKDANNNNIQDDEEACGVVVTKKRNQKTYDFLIGGGGNAGNTKNDRNSIVKYNVYQNQIENEGADLSLAGDKIYLSGMGGNSVRLDLNKNQIQEIRDNISKNHWAITRASIKVYADTETQGALPIPQYLHVYNYTQKELIPDYKSFPFATISEPYKDGYYRLNITQFIKNIVEKNAPIDALILKMGNYIKPDFTRELFYKPPFYNYSDDIYNPYRLVAFGGNKNIEPAKRIQLEIIYSDR